jgi:hypothetical protein
MSITEALRELIGVRLAGSLQTIFGLSLSGINKTYV